MYLYIPSFPLFLVAAHSLGCFHFSSVASRLRFASGFGSGWSVLPYSVAFRKLLTPRPSASSGAFLRGRLPSANGANSCESPNLVLLRLVCKDRGVYGF